jgi:dihydroceramide fatty acyl 2-hydroxylase
MAATQSPESLASTKRADLLKASPRMFDSNLLDKLSRVHPVVPPLLFIPAIVAGLMLGFEREQAGAVLLLVIGGYVFWTLTEYWLHRLVFHFEPEDGIGARLHWIIHGVHHDHPNDPLRLVMPPSVSIPLSALFFWLFTLTIGTPGAYPFAAGFWAGYLGYDMLHYYMHHLPGGRKPRSWLLRRLHELHMRHHFQDHETGYGVSAPFWDRVFGTAPRLREQRERRTRTT